ncbi:MAG: heat-inducible transcriptional repressor HrcA [Lachnospiraceae bacterium]|nr:heat-inducible transcriptional repressor HrcA [Lachnospiraceae bacterium]
MSQLDERKVKILQAVIRNYLETGEPVGSRTISKYTDLNLSSATIRNEMADLEELGYIVSPHTSAGRIPTDMAYRLYVDSLMEEKVERDREMEALKGLLIETEGKMDKLLKNVAKVLATNTNYASIVSAPQIKGTRIKFLQLSRISDDQLLVVVMVEGNVIKNNIITLGQPLDEESILKLNIMLNTYLNGLTVEEINLGMIAGLKAKAGGHSDIIANVIDAVAQVISADEDMEIYTSGATNILKYPELADKEKAGELLSTFEEKQSLARLATETLSSGETGIQVYIGEESQLNGMKDCSVVTATYDLGGGMRGSVAIVGPKRMDYEKVMDTLKGMQTELERAYNKKE